MFKFAEVQWGMEALIFDSYLAISGENRFERMLEIGLERGNIDWESKHIWNKLSD